MSRRKISAATFVAGAALLALGAGAAGAAGLALAQEQPGPTSPAPETASPSSTAEAPAPANSTADPLALPEEIAPPPPSIPAPVAEEAAVPPGPPAPPPEPLKRPRMEIAVLQAADKVTAETLRFEARVGETVRYRGLLVTVRACEATAADEPVADSAAHLEIQSQPQPVAGRPPPASRQLFRGWMYASTPSLHPLESPGYDVWLIACKTNAPSAPSGTA